MNTALPDEVMKFCPGHGRKAPLRCFRPTKTDRCGDNHSCPHPGHYARQCRLCEGWDRDEGSKGPKALDAHAFWKRTAGRRLRQHLPKWSKERLIRDRDGNKVKIRPFVPAFKELLSAERTAAQLDWLEKRRAVTVDAVAKMLYSSYRDEKCPGRCLAYFRDYPPEQMQLAVRNPMLPPTMDNLFALCRKENQQMGTLAWADLLDKWYWSDDWRDGKAEMPVQIALALT